LEEALLRGLCESVPAGAFLSTEKESKVAEQFAGNRYVGIHIALGMDDQEKRPKIFDVFEGGPADRAGVKKDDLLEQIDGVDTKGMDVRQAVDRLRGAEGTDVTIKVRQPKESKSRTMTITRGRHVHATITGIRKRSPGGWDVRLNDADPIGYLRISEISVSTPHELLKLARQLESEGVRALVLDLRGLRGDSLHPAVLLADRLLDRGPIGRVRTARGETTYQADPDALFRGWPMAVLIDLATSGTAEWLAATLQDNHRAILIGEPTRSAIAPSSGALVRSTIPVGDGAWSITLATGQLERGDGRPLGGEVEAARDGQRRLVVAPANLDELERFQKAYRDLIAQTTQNQPIKRTDAHAKPSALGEHSRTGVTPDYLIGEKGPGSARPVQPASPGPSREPTAPADEPLGKAVELLRQSLHKSVSLGSE
ncbi:MAG TPA: S41 family peptidase, partial [Isosphaeraceae bacterium]|nr:S41 family peptidase [Isosphaeraceae bacterium]